MSETNIDEKLEKDAQPAQPDEERKYCWVILFNPGGKVYPYLYRNMAYMVEVLKKFHREHARWPYRVWVIVDGEMQKVNIE